MRRLNRHWGEVAVPKLGWVRFRWSRPVPSARSFRVTCDRAGRWHVTFAAVPPPIPAPGTGEVIGVDRSAEAVSAATARAEAESAGNVSFLTGDPAEMVFERPFDAVVGRFVLQFQDDPATMLEKLAGNLRPGGVIVFHELDWSGARSSPPASIFDDCRTWVSETIRLSGHEVHMGAKLHSTFVAAGLPAPTMRLEALVGGGERASGPLQLMAAIARSVLPAAQRLGVAAAAGLDPETLFERMSNEVQAKNSFVMGLFQIGAWSQL